MPIRREILRARLEGSKMLVTYINDVKEGWSHRFLGQMHTEVLMRSRCRCTRLLTFCLMIRLIRCKCLNKVVREMFLHLSLHIHPARLFGNANAKEKDSISGECSQRGSDDVMAKQ